MIERAYYLDKIESYVDKPFIKVIAGIRRAGKSSLLAMLKERLIKRRGISANQIAYINFDSLDYTSIRTKEPLVALFQELLEKGVHYFLLDEIQNIENWDEAVSALFAEAGTDIFITGSNSKLLSSELSTFFTGRFVDLRVSTLNFREFLDFRAAREIHMARENLANEEIHTVREPHTTLYPHDFQTLDPLFREYLARGGFPSINLVNQTEEQDNEEVSDILSSIIFRDIVERKKLRNTELLRRILRFAFDNVGSVFSAKSVSDYLKNEHLNLSQETVYKYLGWLEEAFVLERVHRFDLRGRAQLKTDEKFYLGDISLLYALNGKSNTYLSGVLENVVYHELISRGYEVMIGRNGSQEIDFVATKNHRPMYLQVAVTTAERSTSEREFGAFKGIDDNYPKYVLTLDNPDFPEEHDGIMRAYLPEFILHEL